MDKMLGERSIEQMHQLFGRAFCLWFKEKNLKPNIDNHLLGKVLKFIQGSDIRIKSGLCLDTNLFSANLEGWLAMPLMFQ
jgi:hypothetical protein